MNAQYAMNHLLTITILASLLVSSANGEGTASTKAVVLNEEKPLKAWPSEKRPRLFGKYLEVEVDGPAEKRIKITSGNRKFIFEDEGRWIISPTTTPRYSILMSDRLNKTTTFGIAQFSKEEFLQTLEDAEWEPYLESIRSDVIPKEIVYEHYTAEGRSAPYIMKNWTRKVEYEYPMGAEEVGKTREIFTFIDGDLFVFVFSGKKQVIDAMRESHDIFLTRMNVYTDS